MNDFYLWYSSGVEHIADWQGYDHILFVSSLVFAFEHNQFKKLFILITAFTIGHSLTLALSAMGSINAPRHITEFLIAISILFSSVYQLITLNKTLHKQTLWLYLSACAFGLIHGLGFSYLLRSMLGHQQTIFGPLLYFNLGIETGQLLIVAIVLLFSLFLIRSTRLSFLTIKKITLCFIALIALKLCVERLQELV